MSVQNLRDGLTWLATMNGVLGIIAISQGTGKKKLLSQHKYISFAFFLWSALIDFLLLIVLDTQAVIGGVQRTLVRNGMILSTVTTGVAFVFWILFLVNRWSPGLGFFGCFGVVSVGVVGLLLCLVTCIVMHTNTKPVAAAVAPEPAQAQGAPRV